MFEFLSGPWGSITLSRCHVVVVAKLYNCDVPSSDDYIIVATLFWYRGCKICRLLACLRSPNMLPRWLLLRYKTAVHAQLCFLFPWNRKKIRSGAIKALFVQCNVFSLICFWRKVVISEFLKGKQLLTILNRLLLENTIKNVSHPLLFVRLLWEFSKKKKKICEIYISKTMK